MRLEELKQQKNKLEQEIDELENLEKSSYFKVAEELRKSFCDLLDLDSKFTINQDELEFTGLFVSSIDNLASIDDICDNLFILDNDVMMKYNGQSSIISDIIADNSDGYDFLYEKDNIWTNCIEYRRLQDKTTKFVNMFRSKAKKNKLDEQELFEEMLDNI